MPLSGMYTQNPKYFKVPPPPEKSCVRPCIHNCHPIEVILEKRYTKFVWSLNNSRYALYSNILRFSLQNDNSTMGENVRYLMHKYDIVNSAWININILFSV